MRDFPGWKSCESPIDEEDKNADTRFPLFAQPPCCVFRSDIPHLVSERGCAMTPDATLVDLDAFTDPHAKVLLLDQASGGDADMLAAIQAELRREETRGWCQIIYMTDDLAVVRWLDQFVLTLEDASVIGPQGGDDVE